ncbi:MAG: hypothetical protein IPM79_36390 [Polyangiaceae bacterium]|nr:hypothetical protein [Polyangiaceae bacterium]MBK8942933.1 hypothetical protein [Polyangiaceae bacterium]
MIAARLAAVLGLLLSCRPKAEPTNDAECAAAEACQTHGRCTFHIQTKKCVVGSSDDCQKARICHKENLCTKVGDACGKE